MEEKELLSGDGGEKSARPAKNKKHQKIQWKEKTAELLADKRSFSSRLKLAALAAFTFAFTFFLFGPFDIYLNNMSFFAFSGKYMVLPVLLAGLGIFAGLTLVLSLLRGRLYNYALSILFGLTVAGYLQGTLLNIDHGSLDGSDIIWQEYRLEAMLGLLFWGIVVLIPLALQYFSKKLWRKVISFLCVVLIGAQTVALGVLFVPTLVNGGFGDASGSGYLTREDIYHVSGQKNVVVFMLDRFDKTYADHQLNGDPSIKKKPDPAIAEGLKGFTYYENFTGSYTRTYPSVVYLLTGIKTDYTLPVQDYFAKAWSEGTFLKDIRDAGYDCRIYSELNYIGGKIDNMAASADNIANPTGKIPGGKILSAMYTLSAFRYVPEFMKPYYHTYTGDLSYSFIYGNQKGASPYGLNDLQFRNDLLEEGLTVEPDSKGTFAFYHLQGSHDPFTMDGEGNKASFSNFFEGRFEQTRGNLKTIFAYIEMLKEKDLYDNTTIIITADHGYTGYYTELNHERVLSLFIKPAGADPDAPMQRSRKQVCQDNLRASISSYFGLTDKQGNRTIESIGENEEMVRYFWMCGTDPLKTRRDVNLITYEIRGDANNFKNWTIVSKVPVQYPYYDAN